MKTIGINRLNVLFHKMLISILKKVFQTKTIIEPFFLNQFKMNPFSFFSPRMTMKSPFFFLICQMEVINFRGSSFSVSREKSRFPPQMAFLHLFCGFKVFACRKIRQTTSFFFFLLSTKIFCFFRNASFTHQ